MENVIYSGSDGRRDAVFSLQGTRCFDQQGNYCWVNNADARKGIEAGTLFATAMILRCERCGAAINEVRSGDFPKFNLCNECFGTFIELACVTPPAMLVDGYAAVAMSSDEMAHEYCAEVGINSSRDDRLDLFEDVIERLRRIIEEQDARGDLEQ